MRLITKSGTITRHSKTSPSKRASVSHMRFRVRRCFGAFRFDVAAFVLAVAQACQHTAVPEMIAPMKLWNWKKEDLPSAVHSIRTAGAATVSVCVARLIGMPEAYWAAIATLVVMQSTLGATLTSSIERIVASALGASLGAVESTYFGSNLIVFAVAIFLLGVLSFVLRLEKTGYRYASVTLTIIVLIPRTGAPWIIAAHRFIEVSVGIVVALAVVAIWEERQRLADNTDVE